MTSLENTPDDAIAPDKSTPNMKPSQAVSVYRRIGRAGLRINKAADEAWKDWTEVLGPWILDRIAKAEQLAGGRTRGTQKTQQLQKQFGKEFYPIYQELSDNGTLSQLRNCLRELDAVNAYRSRLSERPGSPDGMWRSFEYSRHSSPKFEDTGADASVRGSLESDDDNDDNDSDEPRRSRRSDNEPGSRRGNREPMLLAEIEKLNEQLAEHRMSIYPEMNANRIWRRLVEVVGADKAGELATATAAELDKIGKRVIEADHEWKAAKASSEENK